ncbi:MAG: transporter substrate-binding domain-containing protein [Thomasclavelia sp.]|jgi:ABC-type amino acid transport substrate-binding protein|nr:transporter substrate-binding domain-containing protein [Thomasclavelia sp.]
MKKILSIVVCTLMVVGLVGCSSSSSSKEKLYIGISPDYAPYESLDDNNKMVGFDIDMTKELFKIMNKNGGNYTYEFSKMSFDNIVSAVQSEQVDLGISGFTYDKKRKVLFSSNYYLKSAQVILVNKSSTATTKDDLKGKAIGAQLGATGVDAAKDIEGAEVTTMADVKVLAETLKSGGLDAVVIDSAVAKNYAKNADFKVLETPLVEEENYVITKQGNKDLMKKVDKAIKEFTQSKKYQTLKTKWGL